MKRALLDVFVFVMFGLVLCGCSGVSVEPLTTKEREDYAGHKGKYEIGREKAKSTGYVVYEPIIVFSVAEKEMCFERKDAVCTKPGSTCEFGSKTVFPNYDRPYLVTPLSGLGKSGIELTFTEGWLLSN